MYNSERWNRHLGACLDGWLFGFRLRVLEPRRDSNSCCPKATLTALVPCRCRLSREYGSCCQHVLCLWPRALPFLSALGLLSLIVVSEQVRKRSASYDAGEFSWGGTYGTCAVRRDFVSVSSPLSLSHRTTQCLVHQLCFFWLVKRNCCCCWIMLRDYARYLPIFELRA